MSRNYALEGWQAAQKRRYLGWVLAGFFLLPPFSLALPWLQRRLPAPEVPARVLREGPTEAVAQQVFIAAYVSRAHARRRRKAWHGFAASFWLFAFLFVASLFERVWWRYWGTASPTLETQQGVERNTGAAAEQEEVRRAQEAARRRDAEEARLDREAALREQIPARLDAIGALYDTIAETHEAVARVLADEWEQRWARDRATMAQFRKRQFLANIEATREIQGLEGALGRAEAEYRSVELELADVREQLAQAQAAAEAIR